MQEWEYKIQDITLGIEYVLDAHGEYVRRADGLPEEMPAGSKNLEELGSDGWELVTVFPYTTRHEVPIGRAYFKRAKSA